MRRRSLQVRGLGPSAVLALAAFVAALLVASTAQTAPGDIADLSLTKTDRPDPVTVDTTLTYTIVVDNLGPQGATNVTVTDRLPSQSRFVSASANSGSCERKGRQVTCQVGNLSPAPGPGNTATVTVQVLPTRVGTIQNSASVDSVENDLVSANDTATASTEVVAAPPTGSCRGVGATIVGTRGSDSLTGTGGPDVIAGLSGSDLIVGLAGRDLLCAGGGNDRVRAGPASDRAFGGAGRDNMLGRGGPDLLAGNAGGDDLAGNRGNDRLRGGAGFDLCSGDAGFDRVRGCERER
jgi:uncharacterized repeat protein (TIGR01451 family)